MIVRKLLAALGAVAVGTAASACSTTPTATSSSTTTTTTRAAHTPTTLPATPGRADRAATRTMSAALRRGGAEASLHYVSTSTGNGLTTTITGDVNRTSGTQTIVLSGGQSRATIVIELVGREAYFRGDAAAIQVLVGVTEGVATAAAGRWVSVVPTDAVYQSTAAALTVGSVISELALAQPVTGGRTVVVGGRDLLQLSGAWVGEGVTAKDHATGKLDVTRSLTPLPVSFSGVTPATAGTSRFVESIVVSRWGEPVEVARPLFSVPLATIRPGGTTTTQPVVV